jgi:hypothetical protein
MEREQNIEVARAYSRVVQPWTEKGLEPPSVSVKEIAREAGIKNPSTLVSALTNGGITFGTNGYVDNRLVLENNDGFPVEDVEEAARRAAPYKRAVKEADYRSRAPGGGPVVKRRVNQRSLRRKLIQFGKERLKVGVEDYSEDEERTKKRNETIERLGLRWQGRTEVENPSNVSEEGLRKASSFMSFVDSASVMSPQRPGRIKELVAQAASGTEEVFFVNWICPPGTPLEFDEETGKLYRLFSSLNPETGFEKDYRLSPRIDLEKRLVEQIEKLGTEKATYIKSIADDNPYCLYPACIRLEGEAETLNAIEGYSEYVQGKLDTLIGEDSVWVMRWSELLGPELFQEFLERFRNTSFEDLEPYLPPSVLETELDVLFKHTNPDPKLLPIFRQFAKDVIAQYNIEMDILYDAFGDNVVLAWNESTRRGSMLDALRKLKGRPPIPKVYVLHRKENEEIVNNF